MHQPRRVTVLRTRARQGVGLLLRLGPIASTTSPTLAHTHLHRSAPPPPRVGWGPPPTVRGRRGALLRLGDIITYAHVNTTRHDHRSIHPSHHHHVIIITAGNVQPTHPTSTVALVMWWVPFHNHHPDHQRMDSHLLRRPISFARRHTNPRPAWTWQVLRARGSACVAAAVTFSLFRQSGHTHIA